MEKSISCKTTLNHSASLQSAYYGHASVLEYLLYIVMLNIGFDSYNSKAFDN